MFFFFSSRRRHTRLTCDWSSDVCSSDLMGTTGAGGSTGTGLGFGGEDGSSSSVTGGTGSSMTTTTGAGEVGRAACRGREESGGGARAVEKKKKEAGEVCRVAVRRYTDRR